LSEIDKLRADAMAIFSAGLAAADPKAAVRRHLRLRGDTLCVGDRSYSLKDFDHIFVVGAGKAGAAMASAVETILDDRITAGHVTTKYGHLDAVNKIVVHEAGHPVPDEAGVQSTGEILKILQQAGQKDLVLCLLSGGGSALLPLPVDAVSLAEKQDVTRHLLGCGAAIEEINAVRKHLSQIKGGQLARLAYPATLVTLILSDVVGDPLDAIASGPTVTDPTTFAGVQEILQEYGIWPATSEAVRRYISEGLAGKVAETPKVGDPVFDRTQNVLIGSNIQAVQAAAAEASKSRYHTLILSSLIEGETKEVAQVHTAIAREVLNTGNPVAAPACLISGGETTVTLHGHGKGGRNQEFVLAAAVALDKVQPVVILSAGTDGTDGPTDAAGAICDGHTVARAGAKGLDAAFHLREHNAYPFFSALNDLIITGPTNTNVMDLRIVMIGDA